MPPPDSETPAWLTLLLKVWPLLVTLVGLIWAAIELRVRKLIKTAVDASSDASEERWRRELQGPIGEIGIDAMKAREKAEKNEPRIASLETKMGILWGMIERSTADLLRHKGEDE